MKLKIVISLMLMTFISTAVNAAVCKKNPGNVVCSKGNVKELTGNGMVSINATTVTGPTLINGMLTAANANFSSLNVNGNISLKECMINGVAEIKGGLEASFTTFAQSLDIYSSSIRLINSKINNNLHVHHTKNRKQEIYLDDHSEIKGDIIFDDGQGMVYLQGSSKIAGKIIGGAIMGE